MENNICTIVQKIVVQLRYYKVENIESKLKAKGNITSAKKYINLKSFITRLMSRSFSCFISVTFLVQINERIQNLFHVFNLRYCGSRSA